MTRRIDLTVIDVSDAHAELYRLSKRVLAGEEVVFAKGGTPVAKLFAVLPTSTLETEKPRRRLGVMEGKIKIPDDFDEPLLDDLLDAFEGR